MRYTCIALLGCALLGSPRDEPVLLDSSEVRFEGEGIKGAELWRASDDAAADALIRWPVGVFESDKPDPVNTHDMAFRIVVIEGTGIFQFEGGSMRELKPGGYVFAPAKAKHVLGCKAGRDGCLFFVVYSPAPPRPKR